MGKVVQITLINNTSFIFKSKAAPAEEEIIRLLWGEEDYPYITIKNGRITHLIPKSSISHIIIKER